jgi:cell wall-associated NlpC family hydrolase
MGSERMPIKIYLKLNLRAVFLFLGVLIAGAMLLIAVSCTTKKMQAANAPHATQPDRRSAKADVVEKRILDEYRQWQGTRHRLGGNDSKGIDCSGFVKEIYQDVFNINLPRTTMEQVKWGKAVTLKELQPGDLVFFKPPTYARHVGIFLSQSEFVHASKKKGVTVSKIDANYWGKYFWTARRILPDI